MDGTDERVGQQVQAGLAVGGHQGVDVDNETDPVGGPICGAGDGHAPVAGATEHDVVEVLELEHRHHVLHMGGEVNRLAGTEVGPLAHASQGGGEDLVAPQPQTPGDGGPLPATSQAPCTIT